MPAFDLGLSRDGGLTHVLDKGLGPRGWEDVLDSRGRPHRHRQARLGHRLRDRATCERKLEVLKRQAGRDRRHLLRGRLRPRQARRVQAWLTEPRDRPRRDLRRHRRDPARAQARADRRLRPRLHRPLRGRLEGLGGRLRAVPVGAVAARGEVDAGAWKVITEAREGGSAGIFRKDGDMRTGLIDEIAHELDFHDIVWEAPTKASQAWFVKHFGADGEPRQHPARRGDPARDAPARPARRHAEGGAPWQPACTCRLRPRSRR